MQTTNSVLMIRPARFAFNPDTAINNRFQRAPRDPEQAQHKALEEFDGYVETLRQYGVDVLVVQDTPAPHTPDSIFPNNWWSSHADGSLVLYPMEGQNRRLERQKGVLKALDQHYAIRETIDFSPLEQQNIFLEGTGSMVLDREHRISYACHSGRTHADALRQFAERLNYTLCLFHAVDRHQSPIYHSNVMMSVGRHLSVVCLQALPNLKERTALQNSLHDTGKEILTLNWDQLESFAGNMLELHDKNGQALLVMSRSAWRSLEPAQQQHIERHTQPVVVNIDHIESIGGGSARCMLAEIHLPTLIAKKKSA
ncbi:arginine deiminase-related protein [Pseudomonas sp. RTB3]|uniref:citrulline utilization hydrolase CtlX n=1 Tax=unclassified Pseudomonas TaxID=196821 RepID=UPI002B235002|nr:MULTISPECIES: arginine deiminase-related protein [unclassified Pseudomonas]MEB0008595.1 arginine deiminase-related protein [Pseudomonas sp. RTB2]MEB0018402.1 arginine deiminase-related protein [Pseudomonas sp. RTB3]MEB0271275.1 arginine deiminase-related protein [Pseudomonas sp. 5B4]